MSNKFPAARQTEFSVIAMLIRHKSNIEMAFIYGLDVDCFYYEENRSIFTAIDRLKSRKAYIDQFTIIDELALMGSGIKQEQLKELVDKKVEHSDALIGYISQLIELKNQRAIIEKNKVIEEISLSDKTADEKIELISNEIASVASRKEDSKSYNEIDGFDKFLAHLQSNIDNKGNGIVKFGFESVDKTINLIGGSLNIISAPPGGGKTAFLQQIADHNALRGLRGMFFTLEMNIEQLFTRKVQSVLGIQSYRMYSGFLSPEDHKSIIDLKSSLSENIIYNDTANIEISKLRSLAKVEHNKKKLDFICVDYIQLIRASHLKGKREDEEIKFISTELLGLAKDLNVPIIALAQMNREFHKNEGKRPTMANLHGGSQLEKDALSIVFLHRQGQFDPTCPNPNQVEIIIAKNRFGNSNSTFLKFNGERVRFEELTYDDLKPEDYPVFEGDKKKKKIAFKS